ncbi:MAG: hypothetical protein GF401_10725 [Chitinivibrionales bacterium]|nr:hypothetical protein [Chitinivibrionales bacterium]
MDRIFSARIDDAVYRKINNLSSKMHTSKKKIIEKAVTLLGKHFEEDKHTDVFDETCGAWKRDEKIDKTMEKAKAAFNESMKRHQR